MKTLVCHHVEPMWSDPLMRLSGKTFSEFCEEIMEHITESDYDRIILTRFEQHNFEDTEWCQEYDYGLSSMVHLEVYAYGWDMASLDGWEITNKDATVKTATYRQNIWQEFTDGGNHSEIVMIEPWMRELGTNVDLCGAFDGECIEDMEIALEAVGVEVNRLEWLIV